MRLPSSVRFLNVRGLVADDGLVAKLQEPSLQVQSVMRRPSMSRHVGDLSGLVIQNTDSDPLLKQRYSVKVIARESSLDIHVQMATKGSDMIYKIEILKELSKPTIRIDPRHMSRAALIHRPQHGPGNGKKAQKKAAFPGISGKKLLKHQKTSGPKEGVIACNTNTQAHVLDNAADEETVTVKRRKRRQGTAARIQQSLEATERKDKRDAEATCTIYSTLLQDHLMRYPEDPRRHVLAWVMLPLHQQKAHTENFRGLIEAYEVDRLQGLPASFSLARISAFQAQHNMTELFADPSKRGVALGSSPAMAAVTTQDLLPGTPLTAILSGAAAQKDKAWSGVTPAAAAMQAALGGIAAGPSKMLITPGQKTPAKRARTSKNDPAAKKKAKKAPSTVVSPVLMQPLLAEGILATPSESPLAAAQPAECTLTSAGVLQALKDGPKEGQSGPALMTVLAVDRSPPSMAALRTCLQQLIDDYDVARYGPGAMLCEIENLDDKETFYRFN